MAGNKEVNSNLEIKGKINLKDVPNNTPTGYLVWNSGIKDIAQRTSSQIISDLGLITATNIAASYYTKTQLQTSGQSQVHWDNISNKPATYPPDTHTHSQYVTLDTAQTITGFKNFQNGFDINSYQFRGLNSNALTIGKNVFGNSLSKLVDSSIAVGDNVFPSMNLQPFDPVTEPWNNKGFLGIGSDIFVDYTGDTNYRPSHNAHDSWIGIGRFLGKGFLDGTNITLLGTSIMHRNDTPYADSLSIVGKGFTSGVKTRANKTLDPNRVVLSKNGYNVHGMMSDVIGMGHENWIEDINQSVVIGSNLRPYTYVFNSLVLGHHHVNMNFEGTTEQADMYLDSDVIIGMGVGKRSSRHAPSHNLLVGMDYFYSTGGAPNANYRPLIEGRFKDGAQLQVNGTIIGGFEKLDDDLPYLESVTFESVSLPRGVVYNASERSFTFDGTQASTSITLHNVPANPNRYVYLEISSSNHTAGSWGFNFYNVVDSGNGPTENWVARQTFQTVSPTTFILTTEGNFKGTLHIILDYTDTTARSINPNILLKDSKERNTFEIRTTQDPSILSMGLNSGKFLTHGGKTLILGNDTLSETPSATDNVLIGSNIFKFGSNVRNNVVLGNAIGGNNTNITHSVLIGNNTLQSNFTNTVGRLTIVGNNAGKVLSEGIYNCLFGEGAGIYLTKGSNNLFLGTAAGLIKEGSNNTFIGHYTGQFSYTNSSMNNTIVIGANAVPEVPNNTTTIATASNTDNFLYGTTHSNAFKVRGGTASQFLKADGSLDSSEYVSSSALSPYAQTSWVNANFIPKSHLVYDITTASINNWNTAFGWGNHAGLYAPINHSHTFASITDKPATYPPDAHTHSQYLTQETDPTVPAHVKSISAENINNWNTAFNNNHSHSNKANLDTINQNLGTAYSPTFQHLNLAGNLNTGGLNYFHNQYGGQPSISVAIGDSDTGFNWEGDGVISYYANAVKLFNLNNVWHSGNFNPSSKADAFENAIGIGLASGQNPNADNAYYPYFYSTYGFIALATRKWVADNYIPKSHPVYNITQANINSWNTAQTLSFSQTTQSTQINISGGNSINIENRFLGSFDGSRNPTDIKPNTSPKSIRADFATAGSVGGTGNYAGVLTYAPWDGSGDSTGDSSYQLAFINETGINGSGNPGLRLRKGIDTTWGGWVSILTSVNGVTLDTAQTISGTKTFTQSITAPAFYESSLKSLKKNIKTFDKSGLDLVNQLDIITFDRKDESAKNKIGIIADDSPKEFLSEELDAVDLYKTVFIQAKAIQELTEEVNNLRELLMTKLK